MIPIDDINTQFEGVFRSEEKTFCRITHRVWSGGDGPPIVLMHEIDGFGAPFKQLALRLAQSFTVHAPVFYEKGFSKEAFYCIRREFEIFRLGNKSRIVDWVCALISDIEAQSGIDRGIGVVGMCLTGGIVLATVSHPAVAAGVAAQPSLPIFSYPIETCADTGAGENVAENLNSPLLTLRFGNDVICPALRVKRIKQNMQLVEEPPRFLDGQWGHATLTSAYRPKKKNKTKAVSERAIKHTISFLSNHLA